MTLAVRNLMADLRETGEVTGGPKPFAPRDRSAFLSALDQAIRCVRSAAHDLYWSMTILPFSCSRRERG